mmetsp:Transcript_33235/g.46386  ORF Transcript_33235/g.46386 Transcript_33235/m.46386 type:complete len:120 (-) Transcript_33235:90-449(-)
MLTDPKGISFYIISKPNKDESAGRPANREEVGGNCHSDDEPALRQPPHDSARGDEGVRVKGGVARQSTLTKPLYRQNIKNKIRGLVSLPLEQVESCRRSSMLAVYDRELRLTFLEWPMM